MPSSLAQQGPDPGTPLALPSHSQQEPTWLLQLPPGLERQFRQDRSVQRMYTLLDALALAQAAVLNWHVLRRLGNLEQAQSVLLLHELLFITLFFVGALVQAAFMFLQPKQYNAARQHIALANRCARLLMLVVGIAMTDIDSHRQQTSAFFALKAQQLQSTGDGARASERSPSPLPSRVGDAVPAAALLNGSLPEVVHNGYVIFFKGAVLEPVLWMLHANWLVPFRAAAFIQLFTFCASAYRTLTSFLCVGIFVTDATAAAAVRPACEKLNWFVHTVEQLLDVQVPLRADQLSEANDAICLQPLVFLVVFHVWVRLIVLLLLPCAAVYCLERHLKGMFLRRFAHAATNAEHSEAGDRQQSQLHAGNSSSPGELSSRIAPTQRGSRHQQRALPASQQQPLSVRMQRLEQVLQAVQPAPAADLLMLAPGCWFVRCCVSAGLSLFVVISCWHLTELGVLAVLQRGQRTLVCDAQGWLRLA